MLKLVEHSPANQATSHTDNLESLFSILKIFVSPKSKLRSNHCKQVQNKTEISSNTWILYGVHECKKHHALLVLHFIEILFCTSQPYFRHREADPSLPLEILQTGRNEAMRKTSEGYNEKKKKSFKVVLSAQYCLIDQKTIMQFYDFPSSG